MNEMTRRRERRTSESSVRKLKCFQRMPASSSWMQMAFWIVHGLPSLSAITASR